MKDFLKAAKFLLVDLASTMFFLILFLITHNTFLSVALGAALGVVIPPKMNGVWCRTHAAICCFIFRFSFCTGVIPPIPMLGRSLLYVQSHCVA